MITRHFRPLGLGLASTRRTRRSAFILEPAPQPAYRRRVHEVFGHLLDIEPPRPEETVGSGEDGGPASDAAG